MPGAALLLVALSFVLAVPLTLLARALGHRLSALDSAGVKGQVKAAVRRVPNTGGVAIFWSFALPLALALVLVRVRPDLVLRLAPGLEPHLPGLVGVAGKAWVMLGAALVLHVMGLIDDRRALPAIPKLTVMLGVALCACWLTDTRVLTMLDGPAHGAWLSLVLSTLWIVAITNAMNFLDNMDGLSPGVGAICAAFFLTSALVAPVPQWFIAACLSLLVGALLGFLVFNFPFGRRGATIFQGDGGSLVVGFLLAFLSLRITYLPTDAPGHALFPALFTPLVILAIPLYDFASVTLIRLSQGKSPFVGDLQHFSHRLVRHGLSRRSAVLVIYGCTAVTAIAGVALPSLRPWQGALALLQTALVLLVLGLYEWSRRGDSRTEAEGGAR